jgi:hypothetical protein
MFTIKIHNDGKEKYQSFEASIDSKDIDDYNLIGYGETEEEAISELEVLIDKRIKLLQNIDWDKIRYVDCVGKTVKTNKNE